MPKKKEKFIDSIAPNIFQVFVLILAVVAAFYIGKLTSQVKFYEEKALSETGTEEVRPSPSQEAQAPPTVDIDKLELLTDGDYVRGDINSKIAIIEYSDIDCPFCATFHETAKQAVDEYPGEVMWIYRHLPLDQLHPEARDKAIATECAGIVGGNDKYWEFLDELFESGVSYSEVSTVAEKVGLNVNGFNNCLTTEEPKTAVEYDEQTAQAVGVRGTPGNFIVNLETEEVVQLRGAEPIQNVRDIIDGLK